jgi:RNA polymerase sigma-70 factor (ECF subfamily)
MRSLAPPRREPAGAAPGRIEAVYRERYAELVRVCRAIVGDREVAHDAVQEGFARALRSRAGFAASGTLEGWLWRIVVNAARDQARARPLALAPVTEPHAAEPDGDPAVRALVARLPERQRLVLFLRYYADLDYAAIAEALEISPGTVGATLHAAHAALRTLVSEESQ